MSHSFGNYGSEILTCLLYLNSLNFYQVVWKDQAFNLFDFSPFSVILPAPRFLLFQSSHLSHVFSFFSHSTCPMFSTFPGISPVLHFLLFQMFTCSSFLIFQSSHLLYLSYMYFFRFSTSPAFPFFSVIPLVVHLLLFQAFHPSYMYISYFFHLTCPTSPTFFRPFTCPTFLNCFQQEK